MEPLAFFCYIFALFFSCILLYYLPFKSCLTRPESEIYLKNALACFVFSLLVSILYAIFGSVIGTYGAVLSVAFLLPVFLYNKRFAPEGLHKRLFMLFVVIHIQIIVTNILKIIFSYFTEFMSPAMMYLLRVPALLVIMFLIGLIIQYWFTPYLRQISSNNMKGLWVAPFAFFFIGEFVNNTYYNFETGNYEGAYLILSFLFTIMFFVLYILLLHMLSGIVKNFQQEETATSISHQLELQDEHYSMLQANIEETKRAKHDLQHHLSVFQTYVDTGETEKLAEYISDYKATLSDDTEFVFCENHAVNAILRHYVSIARDEGIQVDVHIELPENTGISSSDLCIIFGNCIENAIEACRMLSADKYINVNSKISEEFLVIKIDNSFNGIVCKDGKTFLSLKHVTIGNDSHTPGIGISSVEAIAKKYDGEAVFEAKDNLFKATIMLRDIEGL